MSTNSCADYGVDAHVCTQQFHRSRRVLAKSIRKVAVQFRAERLALEAIVLADDSLDSVEWYWSLLGVLEDLVKKLKKCTQLFIEYQSLNAVPEINLYLNNLRLTTKAIDALRECQKQAK